MLLIPYFVHQIESSKTSSELKELLNVCIQQKAEIVDGLRVNGNGKNRFIVNSESIKYLEVHGTITEHGNRATIELKFGLILFTKIFASVVLGVLLISALTSTEDDLWWKLLFFFGAYLANLIGFRITANNLKSRLTRILK